MPGQPGTATPYTLTCSCDVTGSNPVSISQVLFGDVFFCAGASNMQLAVPAMVNAQLAVQQANNYPYIRLFSPSAASPSSSPLLQLNAPPVLNWSPASSSAVGGGNWSFFSATCWFFGKALYDSKGWGAVPLGLIAATSHDSYLPAWLSSSSVGSCPDAGSGSLPNQPSVLYNTLVYPYLPMSVKGIVWYQGEADLAYHANPASYYACAFKAMLQDWRSEWNGQDFYFIYAQLAPFTQGGPYGDKLWQLRLAQASSVASIPRTCMVTTIDLGDYTSPFGNTYPRSKPDVGTRLAKCALSVIYSRPSVVFTGPKATKATLLSDTGQISVSFDPTTVTGGLNFLSPSACPQAGECAEWQIINRSGQPFTPTDVQLVGNTVVLTNPLGSTAASLRYACSDWPLSSLYNSYGMPAPPFNLSLST